MRTYDDKWIPAHKLRIGDYLTLYGARVCAVTPVQDEWSGQDALEIRDDGGETRVILPGETLKVRGVISDLSRR